LANLEQAALVEKISGLGGRMSLKEEAAKLSKIKDKKISRLNFLQSLFRSANERNVPLAPYPNLFKYEAYLRGFAEIDFESFLNERERLEDEVYRAVIGDSKDALLLRSIDRYLALLDSAFRIQMSTKQFHEFELNEPDFSTAAYLAFLNRK